MVKTQVPFFRPDIATEEIEEVVETLRSGWLTSGPRVKRFEQEFAAAVGAQHAIAVNSCTAALHLALEALQLKPGDRVLVPTMTFAATAEVVRYLGAMPILVDCDPQTGNMDLDDAENKLVMLRASDSSAEIKVVGMIPVHVGGLMMNMERTRQFASKHGLWVVEDAAHAMPAAWRATPDKPWQRCGEDSSDVTCFSFYANKTITTGEGGMAVTRDPELADRLRLMSLHGLSHDAWGRYENGGKWDYQIIAPGFKYNLTDIAAAIGIHQLKRAEQMRVQREAISRRYMKELSTVEMIELPVPDDNRVHSWHLFPIKLNLDLLTVDRNQFMEQLKDAGVGCSVHWRPLHLHPYYKDILGFKSEDFPVATSLWQRLISLPIFPTMCEEEIEHTIQVLRNLCFQNSKVPTTLRKTTRLQPERPTDIESQYV